jgi:hypothetical protein
MDNGLGLTNGTDMQRHFMGLKIELNPQVHGFHFYPYGVDYPAIIIFCIIWGLI